MEMIFIRRPGSSTLRVRVFRRRPRAYAAARAMCRRKLPIPMIAAALRLPRARVQAIANPFAAFIR